MDGRPGLVLSASKELEPGARSMILLAEGLFRLDVIIDGDTLRTIVRNLSSGELDMKVRPDYDQGAHFVVGDVADYEPARTDLEFVLGAGADRVEVRVLLGMLKMPARGTVRVTGQAIARSAAVS